MFAFKFNAGLLTADSLSVILSKSVMVKLYVYLLKFQNLPENKSQLVLNSLAKFIMSNSLSTPGANKKNKILFDCNSVYRIFLISEHHGNCHDTNNNFIYYILSKSLFP